MSTNYTHNWHVGWIVAIVCLFGLVLFFLYWLFSAPVGPVLRERSSMHEICTAPDVSHRLVFSADQRSLIWTTAMANQAIKTIDLNAGKQEQLISDYGGALQVLNSSEILFAKTKNGSHEIVQHNLEDGSQEPIYKPTNDDTQVRDYVLMTNSLQVLSDRQNFLMIDINTQEQLWRTDLVHSFAVLANSNLSILSRIPVNDSTDLYGLAIFDRDEMALEEIHSASHRCEIRPLVHPNGQFVSYLSFAPNTYPDIYLFDIENKTNRAIVKSQDLIESYMTWSSDGRYLAFIAQEPEKAGDLFVYDLDTDEVQQITQTSSISEFAPIWDIEGLGIYFLQKDAVKTELMYFDPATGTIETITALH